MATKPKKIKAVRDIDSVPINIIVPDPLNARLHPPEQIEQIKRSIKRFGFNNPLLVVKQGDNEESSGLYDLLAGHGRLEAAKELGMTRVPVIVLPPMPEEARKAFALADNKIAENAEWDEPILQELFTQLRAEDFDLSLTGFDEKEIAKILGTEDEPEEEEETTNSSEAELTCPNCGHQIRYPRVSRTRRRKAVPKARTRQRSRSE